MTELDTRVEPPANTGGSLYRSVSQLKQYNECPYRYYLARIEKVWERPAAWLSMGLAVHEAIEAHERSERTLTKEQVEDAYVDSYVKHTNRLCAETPRFDYWFASGPYRGEQDVERRFNVGLTQAFRYHDAEHYPVWITPEGEPAIELGFDLDLDGVPIRGYIDQVIDHPTYGPHVRDIKSGAQPGDDFQLAVYAVAVNAQHSTEIVTGDYWMGKTGKPTKEPYDLSYWTKERVTEEFHRVDALIKAEKFDPDPEPKKCDRCPVAASCQYRAA